MVTYTQTILIRGGSIAAGHGVCRGYADILKDWCVTRKCGLINRSRFQDNTFDGVRTFDEDITPFRPAVLIIHFGIDDTFGCVYKSEFKENLVRMVRKAREQLNPFIIMPTSQPFEAPSYMQPALLYYQIIKDVCHDLDCLMVPVHSYWNGMMVDKQLAYPDLVQENVLYPNERGHEIFAEAIVNRLCSIDSEAMYSLSSRAGS